MKVIQSFAALWQLWSADALSSTCGILQVCVLEEVAGLQASLEAEGSECPLSPHLSIGVSLRQGAPVLLLFFLTGDSSSFSETREMTQNGKKEIYHIRNPIQGISYPLKQNIGRLFWQITNIKQLVNPIKENHLPIAKHLIMFIKQNWTLEESWVL